jgi:hypothetical protein
MTLVQGANVYVEQKIANLGTNVFRIARTPFVVTDFTLLTNPTSAPPQTGGIGFRAGFDARGDATRAFSVVRS